MLMNNEKYYLKLLFRSEMANQWHTHSTLVTHPTCIFILQAMDEDIIYV